MKWLVWPLAMLLTCGLLTGLAEWIRPRDRPAVGQSVLSVTLFERGDAAVPVPVQPPGPRDDDTARVDRNDRAPTIDEPTSSPPTAPREPPQPNDPPTPKVTKTQAGPSQPPVERPRERIVKIARPTDPKPKPDPRRNQKVVKIGRSRPIEPGPESTPQGQPTPVVTATRDDGSAPEDRAAATKESVLPNAAVAVARGGKGQGALARSTSNRAVPAMTAEPTLSVEQLEAVRRRPPRYPASARSRGREGFVEIEFSVTETGETGDIEIIVAEPPGLFEGAVREAVAGWRFTPHRVAGRPREVRVRQRIGFRLRSPAAGE